LIKNGMDQLWLNKLLHHFRDARHLAVYNSNRQSQAAMPPAYITFDWLFACSNAEAVSLSAPYFEALENLLETQPDYYCGFLGYDLKNETEKLNSRHPDSLNFAPACFFRPQLLIVCVAGKIKVIRNETAESWDADRIQQLPDPVIGEMPAIKLLCRTDRAHYLEQVARIRDAIEAGTYYELNYCVEWFAEKVEIDPIQRYLRLNTLSPTPFSGYFQSDGQHLLCGSPERFFARYQQQLYSQPIKGTRKRSQHTAEDAALKVALANDQKERAENVMIVDLVRNDLARSCVAGSVQVPELMQVYSFPTVHQMISTVSGQIRPDISTLTAIKNAFPMGSMTGAPKIMAMQHIDALEDSRRSLYAGAFGYFSPEGNCDFNVVIRSLLYNSNHGYLSFSTGGAITYDSVAEAEWEECQLKAATLLATLEAFPKH
jgi:para-aminobenzoate synthetase component 1